MFDISRVLDVELVVDIWQENAPFEIGLQVSGVLLFGESNSKMLLVDLLFCVPCRVPKNASYLVVLCLDDMIADVSTVDAGSSDGPHELAGCIRIDASRDVGDASVLGSNCDQVVDRRVVASLNVGSMIFSKKKGQLMLTEPIELFQCSHSNTLRIDLLERIPRH